MTWNTPLGNRILTGVEERIVRCAIRGLTRELLETSDEFAPKFAIPVFDDLNICQKLVMLDYVKLHLLDETATPNSSSAVIDGTVGAVFGYVAGRLDWERFSEEDFKRGTVAKPQRFYRKLLLRACRDFEWDIKPQKTRRGWATALQILHDRVLHDTDYEMDFGDLPPDECAGLKLTLGISPEYFASIPFVEPDGPAMVEVVRRLFQ